MSMYSDIKYERYKAVTGEPMLPYQGRFPPFATNALRKGGCKLNLIIAKRLIRTRTVLIIVIRLARTLIESLIVAIRLRRT